MPVPGPTISFTTATKSTLDFHAVMDGSQIAIIFEYRRAGSSDSWESTGDISSPEETEADYSLGSLNLGFSYECRAKLKYAGVFPAPDTYSSWGNTVTCSTIAGLSTDTRTDAIVGVGVLCRFADRALH